jgi:hypothetical protein
VSHYKFEQAMFQVELEARRQDEVLEQLREARDAGTILLPPPQGSLRARRFESIIAELRRQGFFIREQWVREGGRRVLGLSLGKEPDPGEEHEDL